MKNIKLLSLKIFKHPLFSGSMIMFLGGMGSNIINYAYHLVMGRLLGPINYGVLSSLYSVLYIISIIPSSASMSIVKFISSTEEGEVYSTYETIRKFVLKIAMVLSLLFLLLSPLIGRFLHIDNTATVALVAPILFLALITLVNQASSQGLVKFYGFVLPGLISSLLKLVFGVGLILLGWLVFGAMFAMVIGMIFSYFYSYKFIKKHIKQTKTHPVSLKPFIRYSGPVLLQSLAFTSIFTIDVILVKHFLDPFSAGIYAAISTLGKIIFFATSPIIATMFPVVSKRRSLNQDYKKIFFLSLLITIIVGVTITIFYWFFPDIAIGVLYGKEYLSAKTDLVWMGVFMIFYTLSNLLVNFYLSIGRVKIVAFPLLAALAQAGIIWFYHNSITQVIQISLLVTLFMFICLSGFTGYNLAYEERKR